MNIKRRNKLRNNYFLKRSKIVWTLEPVKVLKCMFGLDVENEIVKLLTREILDKPEQVTKDEVSEIFNLKIVKTSITAKERKLR